jgi:hypothetical protein
MEELPQEEDQFIQPEILKTDSLIKEESKRDNEIEFSYRQGPILADELKAYDDLVPGFAEQYLTEVLNGAKHQRQIELAEIEQEKRILETQQAIFRSNHKRSSWGTTAGSVIILTAIICATILGIQGKEKTALGIVGSLACVSAIIYGTDAYNRGKMQKLEQGQSDQRKEINS